MVLITPEGTLERYIARWEPSDHPVSCANCLHAKVSGAPEAVTVRCAQGQGRPRTLGQLLRPSSPAGFRGARDCPDFSSMDEDA